MTDGYWINKILSLVTAVVRSLDSIVITHHAVLKAWFRKYSSVRSLLYCVVGRDNGNHCLFRIDKFCEGSAIFRIW